ncbi:MAG: ATP-binding cassette domain-containing protein [Bilophila wadsworthia]
MKDQHSSWDILLEHLRVGYGSRVVLDDINAVLPGGKITVILGESGCGKSTLLRHVIGLSRPMQGHILYGGQDLFALPERQFRRVRRRFGVLFQDGALLGSLTLAENVGLPLHEHTRLPKATIRSTVLRILDLVGLAEFALLSNDCRGDEEARRISRAPLSRSRRCFLRRADLRARSINKPNGSASVDMRSIPEMTPIVVSRVCGVACIAEHAGLATARRSVQALKASTDEYLRLSWTGRLKK